MLIVWMYPTVTRQADQLHLQLCGRHAGELRPLLERFMAGALP